MDFKLLKINYNYNGVCCLVRRGRKLIVIFSKLAVLLTSSRFAAKICVDKS